MYGGGAEKCKSKLQRGITWHQSKWLSSRNPQTINAWEGVEGREPSYTVDGNINWYSHYDFPGGASGKEPACQRRRHKKHGFDPWVRKIPWGRARQSSILAWRIPRTEELSGLQSIHRVTKSQTWLKRLKHTLTHSHCGEHYGGSIKN